MATTDQRQLQLHATVSELLAYLDVDQDPEKFLDLINSKKSYTSKGSTAPLAERIASKAAELSQEAPNRFLSVYDRLLALQTKELEPLLYILNKVHSDPAVAAALDAKISRTGGGEYSTVSTPPPIRKSLLHSTPGLSKSRSFNSLAGSTTFQTTTPRYGGGSLLKQQGRSNSSLFTPSSSRFLNGTTMAPPGTPGFAAATAVYADHKLPTSMFATMNINMESFVDPAATTPKLNLSAISLRDQESLIMEDLLYVLLGIDGEFIAKVYLPNGQLRMPMQFELDNDLDASLADLITRILPLCAHYDQVTKFVEEHSAFEYGRTHHALSAALREMLQEYHIMVAQLEHQAHSNPDFTLQKLWFYLGPTISTFESLASLAADIDSPVEKAASTFDLFKENNDAFPKTGGVLLTLLAERMKLYGGSASNKKLYSYLLCESVKPYFAMLKRWICNGILDDPYKEFMIQERPSLSKDRLKDDFNDVYWEQRYSLQVDSVPSFLEPYKEKILLTGKYLNVLRECSLQVGAGEGVMDSVTQISTGALPEIVKIVEGVKFLEMIEVGYSQSNRILLDLLRKDYRLMERLRSIKTFFLLDQSDYLTHFLDLAAPQLTKEAAGVSLIKVNALLELVVRTPSTASSNDPFRDDLQVEMANLSLFDQLMKINSMLGIDMKKHMENIRAGKPFNIMESLSSSTDVYEGIKSGPLTGIDALSLTFNVSFPLTLVLNKKIMTKYQMIFRHLFKCKYLERRLGSAWLDETKCKTGLSKKGTLNFEKSHVITQLAALRIIDPQWKFMEGETRNASTVEDLLKNHDDFLDTCLKECLLTNPKLIVIISTLINTCHCFVSVSEVLTNHFNGLPITAEDEQVLAEFSAASPAEAIPHIKTLESSFLFQIQSLIDCIQILGVADSARLGSLISQLDYNQFYSTLPPASDFILHPIVPVN